MAPALAARAPRLARPSAALATGEDCGWAGDWAPAVGCVWAARMASLSDSASPSPVSPGWAPVHFWRDCVLCAVPGPLLPSARLEGMSTRRVRGCGVYSRVGHSRRPATLEPASRGSRSPLQFWCCHCPVSWGKSLSPVSLGLPGLVPETDWGGALVLDRQGRVLTVFVGAWTQVWLCPRCDYDTCPGAGSRKSE